MPRAPAFDIFEIVTGNETRRIEAWDLVFDSGPSGRSLTDNEVSDVLLSQIDANGEVVRVLSMLKHESLPSPLGGEIGASSQDICVEKLLLTVDIIRTSIISSGAYILTECPVILDRHQIIGQRLALSDFPMSIIAFEDVTSFGALVAKNDRLSGEIQLNTVAPVRLSA